LSCCGVGYGNRCDGDYDNNELVTAADFGGSFLPQFKAGKPGPSALSCAGTIPCDL
jgi:hypothetical protein